MDSPFSQINSYIQKLPRNSGKLDAILIARLVVAGLLLAAAQYVNMLPVFQIILTVLSILVAGYDIILALVDAVMDRDFFSAPVVLVLIAVLSFLIGSGREGALCVILYQIGLVLIRFAVNQTKRSEAEILRTADADLKAAASVILDEEKAGETEIEKELRSSTSVILKILLFVAVAFAILMPLLTSLSVREAIRRAMILLVISLPLSLTAAHSVPGSVGLSFATCFGALFKNAGTLEKLQRMKTAVLDKNGIFADSQPEFIGVKTDILDENTFMEFVSHAVYYSDQAFAKAILSAQDREYRLDLISDFKDIPGSGVDVKIGGTEVTLAKRELLTERGEAVPYEGKEENSVYYLMVAGKYIGKVMLAENLNEQNQNLMDELKQAGIQKCILLTEDSREEGERLGMTLNADEVYSEFTDETKLQYLESLEGAETIYLYANSLDAHSNAAIDVRVNKKGKYADVLVNPDDLEELPETFVISRRVREVSVENAIGAIAAKAILLFLALTGNCTVWFAVFLEVAAAIATVLNSIRVTKNPLFELPKL